MFRCTDCNAEYKIKPDYCDCGNNTFEEVPQAAKSFKAIPARQIVSIVIFIFCLILAIIPWTIPDKKPQKQPAEPQKSEKPAPAIPNIDKIWNNTVKKSEPAGNIPAPEILKDVQPETTTSQQTIQKKVQEKKSAAKSSAQGKPVKPAAPSAQKTSPHKPSTKTTAPDKKQTAAPVPKNTAQTQQKPQKHVMDKTEFENYKNSIRLALLSKLDLVKISGKGECAIKFSLAQNGKLLNRGFIYQSNNKSLNDQIYYMLMRLPVYRTPPEGYNGEVIKLKFYIDNGAYEISFID